MRVIWALLVIVFLTGNSPAEIHIKKSDIVPNGQPGYCCWASIETLANYLNINAKGLTRQRSRGTHYRLDNWEWHEVHNAGGYEDEVPDELNKRGILFEIEQNHDMGFLEKAINDGYGAVVGVYSGQPTCEGRHAIVLTDLTNVDYTYVDTNDIDGLYRGSRKHLEYNWTGFAVKLKGQDDQNYYSTHFRFVSRPLR